MEPRGPLTAPAFRTLWAAGLISDAGDWLLLIALPIVVFELTGSALGTAAAFAAELAPGIVLAPVSGRLADAVDGRALLTTVSALQALALLPLLVAGDRAGLPIVYAVIIAQASLAAVFNPTKNALLATLVDRDQRVSANALMGLGAGLGRLVGGPLGGLLLAVGSLHAVVMADAISFATAGLLIARLPRREAPSLRREPIAPPTATNGIRDALRDRRIRGALLVTVVAATAQGIFVVLFVVFVARRLHGGPAETGLLRGVQAVGAIGGGLLLAVRGDRWRPAALVAGAAIAFGVVDLAIWNGPLVTRSEAVYVVLFVLAGAPGVAMESAGVSFLQSTSRDHERGRVFAAFGLAENAGAVLGFTAAGVLAAPLGLMTLLNAQGTLYVLSGMLVALWVRRARPSRSAHRRKVSGRGDRAAARSAARS
ncbi:MAG: MFS transporter [Solirubrobacteraceae bacterium]